MPRMIAMLLLLMMPLIAMAEEVAKPKGDLLTWQQLPDLPDPIGFASPFCGVANGALIVAGGANFPEKKPWEGGTKIYHDRVFVLEAPEGTWIEAGQLPRPIAYGVSITTPNGLICIGGNDGERAYEDVFLVQWIDQRIQTTQLPPLPQPVTAAMGVLIGETIYLVGGHSTPNPADSESKNLLLAMDLWAGELPAWQQLHPWPGSGRFLPILGVHEGSLYLFSGIQRVPGGDTGFTFDYKTDAYRYTPKSNGHEGSWKKLADLPRRNAAVPSPAPFLNPGRFVLLGSGADGGHTDKPLSEHPGFDESCLVYDITSDAWTIAGHTPAPRVCAVTVEWHDQWIIASGESHPGIRSSQVWAARPASKPALSE
jgi:N-acetylneuraminic acid mutarotase